MSENALIDLGGRERFERGERVEVAVGWELTGPPDELTLELAWKTAGRGRTDTRATHRRTWTGGLPAAGAEVVSWTMPVGPLTHDGKLVSIRWLFWLLVDGKMRHEEPIELVRPGAGS